MGKRRKVKRVKKRKLPVKTWRNLKVKVMERSPRRVNRKRRKNLMMMTVRKRPIILKYLTRSLMKMSLQQNLLKPPPKLKLLSNTHSPFPKAPPKAADEEDSDDGFESPATPSEDEDDE